MRFGGPKNVDVFGWPKLFDQFARGIVISVDQIDFDACISQTGHLLVEKQRRFKALEPGVIEIARNYEKVNAFGDGGIQYFLERTPRRIPNFLYRSSGVFSETLKRRVKVNICAVDEFHILGFPRCRWRAFDWVDLASMDSPTLSDPKVLPGRELPETSSRRPSREGAAAPRLCMGLLLSGDGLEMA